VFIRKEIALKKSKD